jgi:hypothetical protein
VKEGLKRARHRLKILAEQSKTGNEEGIHHYIQVFFRKIEIARFFSGPFSVNNIEKNNRGVVRMAVITKSCCG